MLKAGRPAVDAGRMDTCGTLLGGQMRRFLLFVASGAVALSLGGCVSQQQQTNNKAAYNAFPAEFRAQVTECEKEVSLNSEPQSPEREAECVHKAQSKVAVLETALHKSTHEAIAEEAHQKAAEAEHRSDGPVSPSYSREAIEARAKKAAEAAGGEVPEPYKKELGKVRKEELQEAREGTGKEAQEKKDGTYCANHNEVEHPYLRICGGTER